MKRLKNIEDKRNNQLLTIKNISKPAIKGNVSDEYKAIQNYKQELIDKNILHLDGVKKFDNIVNKWKQTKDKDIVFKNVDEKVNTRKFNIYKIFENYLNKTIGYDGITNIEKSIKDGIRIYQKRPRTGRNKGIINNSNKVIKGINLFNSMIDNDEFKIPGEYYARPNNNVDLDWMNDKIGYEETAEEADTDYMKGNNDNELKLIKGFTKNGIYKMETFFMNTKNSKNNEPNRFKYNLIDKLDLKNPNKNMALVNLNIYYTWKNVKSIYNNNKFKISASTWNETFDLPDGLYNISEIQDYIEYIIKKHETIGENVPILIYANTINNRIVFKIKSGYKLELLSKETMKLLGSTKDIIDAAKSSENVPRLENVEVVLVHCNLVKNSYQQHSRVLFTVVPTKQYGQLISISLHSLVFLKTMNTDFSEIEVWFTDQNNNALEIEDNVNISLIINTS